MKKILLALILIFSAVHAEKIYATFQVEAVQSADLAFSSSGIVKEVAIDIGTAVKKDRLLAALHNDDIKALVESARVTLKYARKDFERHKKSQSVISEVQFDAYAYKYESAKAQFDYQKALLEKTILKAPFDGIIISKKIEVGDVVSGAMIRTVIEIQSLHERKLLLAFDQKYHATVKPGDRFIYKVDGSDKEMEGVITKIYPAVDEKNRKVLAEVRAKDLMVGLFGEGTILTKNEQAK